MSEALELANISRIIHPWHARMIMLNNTTFTANLSLQVVTFDTIDYDPNNNLNTGSSAGYTAPVAGFYLLSAQAFYNWVGNSVGQTFCGVDVNGSNVRNNIMMHACPATNIYNGLHCCTILQLNKGDHVRFLVAADVGAANPATYYVASGEANWFEIHLLSLK